MARAAARKLNQSTSSRLLGRFADCDHWPAKLLCEGQGQAPGQGVPAGERTGDRSGGGEICPFKGYDVGVENGLSIDPDKSALLIQGVLDDLRNWRGTRRWRFELVPMGQSATLHAYIVTPKTTDWLCAPYLTRGEVSCQNGNLVVLNAKVACSAWARTDLT